MMMDLVIHRIGATKNTDNWWTNFFWSAGDWCEAERILDEEWNAYVEMSSNFSEVGTIKFKNEHDMVMFLLRWS